MTHSEKDSSKVSMDLKYSRSMPLHESPHQGYLSSSPFQKCKSYVSVENLKLDSWSQTVYYVIKTICRIVKFFRKSTFANAQLKIACKKHHITQGLVAIGNTRFGSMYFAGLSVHHCLPAIRELCGNDTVVVPVCLMIVYLTYLTDYIHRM